ncbi:DnaJ-domain-containing protein, partial [Calocera viscosa TUFC12733]
MTTTTPFSDPYQSYYSLLGVLPNATPQQIKHAYHRLVLQHHPDKRRTPASRSASPPNGASLTLPQPETVDTGRLTVAYATLSSMERRNEYDERLRDEASGAAPREDLLETKIRRPAEVVSLDEFNMSVDDKGEVWTYACRCVVLCPLIGSGVLTLWVG